MQIWRWEELVFCARLFLVRTETEGWKWCDWIWELWQQHVQESSGSVGAGWSESWAGIGDGWDLARKGEVFIENEAEVSSRVSGVKWGVVDFGKLFTETNRQKFSLRGVQWIAKVRPIATDVARSCTVSVNSTAGTVTKVGPTQAGQNDQRGVDSS